MDVTIDVSGKVIGFLKEQVLFEDANANVDESTDLLDGVLDSLALMQLVAYLEDEFEVEIDDSDITKDHFSTIADIKSLIQAKAAAS